MWLEVVVGKTERGNGERRLFRKSSWKRKSCPCCVSIEEREHEERITMGAIIVSEQRSESQERNFSKKDSISHVPR